jgi:alpha-N-acetylglucosamine transferase
MGAEGDDITKEHKQFIRDLSSPQLTVEYRTVPDINITNEFSPRFGLNWIKLNSWSMTEFDTVINLDTGAVRLERYRNSKC